MAMARHTRSEVAGMSISTMPSLAAALGAQRIVRAERGVVVPLMGNSILSEVDVTSILRTGLSTCYWLSLNWLRPLGSCPRAAGWSAATLCFGRLVASAAHHFGSD